MMFLFAGHSDKPLKSLISMAHKGNHICLYRFSFIYIVNDLWEDTYTCPIYAMNCTTESAIDVMELSVMGWVPIKEATTKCRHFHLIFYCRLYFTAFTIVSMQLIVNAKMMIERNTLLKCIKTCGITSASVPNNCSIPSKNPLFIILSFSSQMLVNAPSIILVITVTISTLLV